MNKNDNLAYQYDDFEYQLELMNIESNNNHKIAKKKALIQKKKQLRRQRTKNVLLMLCFFSVAFFTVFRYAQIAELSYANSKLNKEYTAKKDENHQREIEVERVIDIKKIEDVAVNQFGMQRPEKSQIIYLDLKLGDYAEISTPPENSDFVLASFFKSIGSFMEYLH